MSQVRTDLVWQEKPVMEYVLGDLKSIVEGIAPISAIYLVGSRAKDPDEQENNLDGKDWDIIFVTRNRIINTHVWTRDKGYHIDLMIPGEQNFEKRKHHFIKELFL
ncbi:MAG: hypothetical protein WBG46_03005 [Nonlabens sp.]